MFGTNGEHTNLLIDDIVNHIEKLVLTEWWFIDNQNFQFKSVSRPRIEWVLHKVFNRNTCYSYQDCILMLYGAICPECDLLTFKTKITNEIPTIKLFITSRRDETFPGKYTSYRFPIHTIDDFNQVIPANHTVKIIEISDDENEIEISDDENEIVLKVTVQDIKTHQMGTVFYRESGPVPKL